MLSSIIQSQADHRRMLVVRVTPVCGNGSVVVKYIRLIDSAVLDDFLTRGVVNERVSQQHQSQANFT